MFVSLSCPVKPRLAVGHGSNKQLLITITKKEQGGCLFILSALDGCQCSLILAFAHSIVENQDMWTWFRELALKAFPTLNERTTLLFSDQQKGLLSAVAPILPTATHCICLYHRQLNLKSVAGLEKKQDLIKDMIRIAQMKTKLA